MIDLVSGRKIIEKTMKASSGKLEQNIAVVSKHSSEMIFLSNFLCTVERPRGVECNEDDDDDYDYEPARDKSQRIEHRQHTMFFLVSCKIQK